MAIKGLIFDMDGLLIDTEDVYYRSSQKAADHFGIPYSKTQYTRYLGLGDDELLETYHRDFTAFSTETIDAFYQMAHSITLKIFAEETVPLKPGVHRLLTAAHDKNIPCVVASSNNLPTIKQLLGHHQLLDHFVGIVSAEDVTRAKPDPEIVEKAAALFSSEKKDLAMLEDSAHGVTASYRAGVPVYLVPDLLVPNAATLEQATAVLHDLTELIPKL